MRLHTFLFILMWIPFVCNAQTAKTSDQLDQIKGLYEVDNSGNISYVAILENLK